jgi:hypothetical protein
MALSMAVLLLRTGVVAATSGAQAQSTTGGDPALEAYAPGPTLTPGSAETLTVQIANDATTRYDSPTERERVTTARNVRVELDSGDAPVAVKTAEHAVARSVRTSHDQSNLPSISPRTPSREPTRSMSR